MIYASTNSAQLWNFEQLSDFDDAEIDCGGAKVVTLAFEISSTVGAGQVTTQLVDLKGVYAGGVESLLPAEMVFPHGIGGTNNSGSDTWYDLRNSPAASRIYVWATTPPSVTTGVIVITNPPPKLRLYPVPGAGLFPTSTGTGGYWKASVSWH